MLQDKIHSIYLKMKLYYYRRIFRRIDARAEDSLTALEIFCAEAISGLGSPTLTEFAHFINVSQPNAAYKIANLEKKGYVDKIKSEEDGRIVHLVVTDKFKQIYGSSERYASILGRRLERRYSQEQIALFSEMLETLSDDMMKEVNYYLRHKADLPSGVMENSRSMPEDILVEDINYKRV